MKNMHRGQKGFTLIELLVVIAVIGMLSTLAMISMIRARELAKEAKAKADVDTLATAIGVLASDTGKWPNGCPLEQVANPEVYLNAGQAGIVSAPVVGDQGSGCTWDATDITRWNGPYASQLIDPWGNAYFFDPDYRKYENCAGQTAQAQTPYIVSFGPNGVGPNAYDCDDIIHALR
jgi:prepilin-type N-terminal cleavage/methylation domain-containing protein